MATVKERGLGLVDGRWMVDGEVCLGCGTGVGFLTLPEWGVCLKGGVRFNPKSIAKDRCC